MKELVTVFPEILLTSLTCLIMVIDVFLPQSKRVATFWLSILSVLGVLVVVATWLPDGSFTSFHGNFVLDPVAIVMKTFLLGVVLMSFFYAKDFFERHGGEKNTFFVLALFSTLGMMVLISAHTLLTVYLGLESGAYLSLLNSGTCPVPGRNLGLSLWNMVPEHPSDLDPCSHLLASSFIGGPAALASCRNVTKMCMYKHWLSMLPEI